MKTTFTNDQMTNFPHCTNAIEREWCGRPGTQWSHLSANRSNCKRIVVTMMDDEFPEVRVKATKGDGRTFLFTTYADVKIPLADLHSTLLELNDTIGATK